MFSTGRYLAVLLHNFMMWRKNPQCSATCCITMLLSLNDLGSGVNSVAAGGKSSGLKLQLGVGGVDMPSMRAAVSDNVGFEIEEVDEEAENRNKGKIVKAVHRFMSKDEGGDTGTETKHTDSPVSDGRRFNRFPSIKSTVLQS